MDGDGGRKKRKGANPRLEEKSQLARRLLAVRAIRGWTPQELAARYGAEGEQRGRQQGIVYSKILKWEATREASEPELDDRQRDALIAVLGVREDWFDASPDELLGGSVLDLPQLDSPGSSIDPSDSAETQPDMENDQASARGSGP